MNERMKNLVYVIDFETAKGYIDPNTGVHIPFGNVS